jgi:hypothetical protein
VVAADRRSRWLSPPDEERRSRYPLPPGLLPQPHRPAASPQPSPPQLPAPLPPAPPLSTGLQDLMHG